jgi:hypothetical protein
MWWLAFVLMTAAASAGPLPQEAYVWQRVWTPDVRAAIHDTAGLFAGYRVLAAETDRNGHLKSFTPDWSRTGTAVVRIDGTLQRLDAKVLLKELAALKARWPRSIGLEIDYDCGTASLSAYAGFLNQVRTLKPARLSITALPAWLDSPDLPAVLAQVDEAVLQVHAVRSPSQGLFDGQLARRWVDRFDRFGKRFRVALPDYGTRVIRSEGGAVIAMESEAPKLIGGAGAEELTATPEEVAKLLADLNRRRPQHLTGIAWFRLPVQGDVRIWSLPTLAAVIRGQPLAAHSGITLRPGPASGSLDILVSNDGDTDTPPPRAVHLPSRCTPADGVGGYRYDAQKNMLIRLQNVLIRAHHERVIGWARCHASRGDFHVEP